MFFQASAKHGLYEIVGASRAVGIGAVYRPRDTKSMRDVALKVLPDDAAQRMMQ
jgi:hypothetical protein